VAQDRFQVGGTVLGLNAAGSLAVKAKANMNVYAAYRRRLPTRFARETKFAVIPHSPRANRRRADAELEKLKDQLLRQQLDESGDPALAPALRRAANEAAALVWLTPCPLLFLPALFGEKVEAAKRQAARQAQIRRRSQVLWAKAA
jgi:hypothetical protein